MHKRTKSITLPDITSKGDDGRNDKFDEASIAQKCGRCDGMEFSVGLNNVAAEKIESNSLREAIYSLNVAVQLMCAPQTGGPVADVYRTRMADGNIGCDPRLEMARSEAKARSESPNEHNIGSSVPPSHPGLSLCCDPVPSPTFFSRPFRIETELVMCGMISEAKVSLTVLYNLALANQTHWATIDPGTDERRDHFLHMAVELYEMAISVVPTLRVDDASSCSSSVLLAAMNNLAVCYYQLGRETDAVSQLFENAWRFVGQIGPGGPSQEDEDSFAVILAAVLSNIGLLHFLAGRFEAALLSYDDALTVKLASCGRFNRSRDQIDAATIILNTGVIQERMGRVEEAANQFQQSLCYTLRSRMCTHHEFSDSGDPDTQRAAMLLNRITLLKNRCSGNDVPNEVMKQHHRLKELLHDNANGLRSNVSTECLVVELSSAANMHNDREEYDEAIIFFQECLRLQQMEKGCHPDVIITLNNIGQTYHSKGQRWVALDFYQMGWELRDQVSEDERFLPVFNTLLHNMGLLSLESNRKEDALDFFQQSLQLRHPSDEDIRSNESDLDITASTLYNIGVIHLDLGHLQLALKALEESLQVRRTSESDFRDVVETLESLAYIHQNLGDYGAALRVHEESLRMEEGIWGANSPETAVTLSNIAQLKYLKMDLDGALGAYTDAWRIMSSVAVSDEIDSCNVAGLVGVLSAMTSIYVELGQIDKAHLCVIEKFYLQGGEAHASATKLSKNWDVISAPAA